MTKRDLRNGMFGVENDGEMFVVVGERLIYEGGKYSDFQDMNDNMEFDEENYVREVHEATCFKEVKEGRSKLIWERPESKVEEVESEECAITITEDQFFEAVIAANKKFFEIGKSVRAELEATMGLQNIAFGELLGMFLFGKESK